MKRYLNIWLISLSISLSKDMMYKSNFLTQIVVEILWTIVTIFSFEIIFSQTETLAGWTKAEVYLIYALYRLVTALFDMFFRRNLYDLLNQVNTGELDMLIVKPVNLLFFVSVRFFSISRVSQLIIGLILVGYALNLGDLKISLIQSLLFTFFIITGVLIRYSIAMMIHLPIFWYQKLENIYRLELTFTGTARLPRQAFPFLFRTFLTYIIPVMFIAAIPAEVILGKSPYYWAGLVLLVAMVLLILTRAFFNFALRHYSSASS